MLYWCAFPAYPFCDQYSERSLLCHHSAVSVNLRVAVALSIDLNNQRFGGVKAELLQNGHARVYCILG